MTTLILSKAVYGDVTIFSGKVEEVLSKEIPQWPKTFYAPAQLPITPTDTSDIRLALDMLNVTREFTITGSIDGNSTSPASNALYARDKLVNMFRSGKSVTFRYGMPADITGSGYGYSNDNMYFAGNGFSCSIRRLMIVEKSKGGSGSEFSSPAYSSDAIKRAPEEFEVTITLLFSEDLT